jgi:hypothetical protein
MDNYFALLKRFLGLTGKLEGWPSEAEIVAG